MNNFTALQQIAEHLNKYKMKQIDIIGNDGSESRFTEFYNLLHEGKLKDDDDAARYFYGKDANASTSKYRKFKSLFSERLLNTVFFIDINDTALSDRQKAGTVLMKEWAAVGLLLGRSLHHSGMELGEHLIREALRYDFFEIALDLISKIKGVCAIQTGDKKKYEYYNNLYKYCFEIIGIEYRARELFERIRINYVKSARFQPEQAEAARLAYAELKPHMEKYDTFNLHFFGRSIELMQYACLNKYAELLPAAQAMADFFKQKTFECRPPMASALQTKLMCCIALKKFEEGEQTAVECLEISQEGSLNWFKTLELQAVLYFHTGEYQKAFDIYDKVRKHGDKKYLQQTYQETWLLIEANLYFLIANGHIAPLSIETANLGNFKLRKFLNGMDTYSKDKQGLNIPTLILKIILLLSEKREDEINDYLEALVKYRQRYVSPNSSAYRSNEFIKVLEQLPKTNFNAKRFENATKRYIKNIRLVPVNVFEDGFRLEMVPYDIIWELALPVMASKTKTTKSSRLPVSQAA